MSRLMVSFNISKYIIRICYAYLLALSLSSIHHFTCSPNPLILSESSPSFGPPFSVINTSNSTTISRFMESFAVKKVDYTRIIDLIPSNWGLLAGPPPPSALVIKSGGPSCLYAMWWNPSTDLAIPGVPPFFVYDCGPWNALHNPQPIPPIIYNHPALGPPGFFVVFNLQWDHHYLIDVVAGIPFKFRYTPGDHSAHNAGPFHFTLFKTETQIQVSLRGTRLVA